LIGAGATVFVVLARLVYANLMGVEAPFILFQVAVLAAAWQGGLKPGLATTVLVIATGFLSQPTGMTGDALALRLGILVTMSILVSLIAERLHLVGRRAEAQKERLRVTLASIGDAVISTDVAGRVTDVNPAAVILTGWTKAEAKGRALEEVFRIINEETRQVIENPVKKALATNKVVGLANHTVLVAKDGSERHIDDSAAPIHSQVGEVVGYVLVFRDISERRQAEKKIDEQIRLTALRADASASLSGDKDMQAGLQTCAEAIVLQLDVAFARIWALDEAEDVLVLQASAGLYTHLNGPHGRVKVGDYKIGRIAKSGLPHLSNDVTRDENISDPAWARREGMVAFAGYPLMVGSRMVGVVAVFARRKLSEAVLADLASLASVVALYIERKRAEETLRNSEAFNRSLMEGSADCIKVLDINGRLLHMNAPGLCQMEIDNFAPFCGQIWSCMWPAETIPEVERGVACARGGKVYSFQAFCPTAKGTPRWWDVVVSPVRNAQDGQVLRLLSISRDITELKRLEEQLREVAARLSDADRKKNEFLATLSHELRNPLAPIRNALQLVRLAPSKLDVVTQARELMERQLQQMVRLIDDLLEISRISQGKIKLQRERIALSTVLENAVESSRPLIEAFDHELTVSAMPTTVLVDADPTRLAQVFLNLLNNAAKYTEQGGRIRLATHFADGEAVVSVKDTGIGIPADMLPKVFDMFTQVDCSLEKSQGGLGIGLSLVKRLVEMHGGSVEARSDGPGQGSEFVVRLPATERIENHQDEKKEQVAYVAARRILIADDNEDSADSLGLLLQIMGNDTREVYDGQAALEAAGEFRPEVVLLDIGMPKLNGLETARKLRKLEWAKGIILIALTGWGQEEDVRRSSEAGFNHHMTKPVDTAALMKLLAESDTE